jgi:predicted PurR-regulated permease PerM
VREVRHYLAIKTWISLATGFLVTVFLVSIGLDYAILWGVLAFMLNYIPTLGSIIAAVPAILLAYIQLGGGWAVGVTAGYLAVNLIMGNLIEPRVMGQGLGLSTLVVFLSLLFWGWVLGPVGMVLSVPLTVTLRIALESRQETRWIAVLLGSA